MTASMRRSPGECRSVESSGGLADGTELNALDLDPDRPVEDPRLDYVSADAFYARYGLG